MSCGCAWRDHRRSFFSPLPRVSLSDRSRVTLAPTWTASTSKWNRHGQGEHRWHVIPPKNWCWAKDDNFTARAMNFDVQSLRRLSFGCVPLYFFQVVNNCEHIIFKLRSHPYYIPMMFPIISALWTHYPRFNSLPWLNWWPMLGSMICHLLNHLPSISPWWTHEIPTKFWVVICLFLKTMGLFHYIP